MSLIQELKRRNVIRMAGLYLVGAWLIVQVAGTLLPMFGAPDWVARSLVLVLAIGFLPALAFAWVFELTPEGLKRDEAVPPDASIAPQTARRMDRLIIAVLLLALGYFALDKFVIAPRQEALVATQTAPKSAPVAEAAATPAPALGRQSIAVLPFADLSPTGDQEYFSDGMAEEILNALAQVKGLKVAGRTSSFQYKGRNEDLRAIGRALGVAHILEGSVRKQGERVRITAQLIQASDGSHLWSETFDGDLRDVFELQENIARAITDRLQVVLEGEQKTRLVPIATTSTEAYELFLQATGIFDRRDAANMHKAREMLQRAVAIDPNYARAWSRLSAVNFILPTYVGITMDQSEQDTEVTARRAIALDARLAEPWAVLAMSQGDANGDLILSRQYFDKALALDPHDVTTNFWYGLSLMRTGYRKLGLQRLEHALAVDPMLPNAMRWRGFYALREGDIDTAEAFLKRARAAGLRIAGRELSEIAFARGQVAQARALWLEGTGRSLLHDMPPNAGQVLSEGLYGGGEAGRARALALLEEHLRDGKKEISGLVPLIIAQLGQPARALEVERTRVHGDNADFASLVFMPQGAALRATPGFQAYLEAKGYPRLWAKYGPPDY